MSIEMIVKAVVGSLSQFSWRDFIDIGLITVLIYKLTILTKGTRAYQVLKGVAIFFLVTVFCKLFDLSTVNWLLSSVLVSGIIIVVVLFQPELRRALEHLGRGTSLDKGTGEFTSSQYVVNEIHRAVLSLAKRRVGALIVIEQKTGLGDIIATGTRINAVISEQLIENIFEPNTPLHDGAAIIRGGQIVAAACFLPLSDDTSIAKELGTRHRAGLGVSAISDSVTIIVSEETGVVSIARDGKLVRYMDSKSLRDVLESVYVPQKEGAFAWLRRRNKNEEEK